MPDFAQLQAVIDAIGRVVIGKESQIELAVSCMLAGGHILIEDVPGVGKTTLSHCLASAFGLEYRRVQFTADLMPTDITGTSVWVRERAEFEFRHGPIFCQVLLADEINRAQPRAQSALLEAMEEGRVTADGVSHWLPSPFFVIATQNPVAHQGTYPLPESQLDRFMMKISLGYPDPDDEEALLLGVGGRGSVEQVMTPAVLALLQASLSDIYVSKEIAKYVRCLVTHTRSGRFIEGVSPRGALAVMRAARAWAALGGEREVHPEHVQAVFIAVARHRVRARSDAAGSVDELLALTVGSVPV